jgi:hypothetical protein
MPSNSRTFNRRFFTNINKKYTDILKRKKKPGITQWTTPVNTVPLPGADPAISNIRHIWRTGDRYFKLANTYYGNPEYWWIIAAYNQAPTEGHLRVGDIVFIPTPLDTILQSL